MIGILPGVPSNVAGFKASGEVTREDYEKVVFPEIRRHIETFGHLNFVFYVDTSLKNFSAGAWVRDIWMGIKEFARWHKVAIISDVEKIRRFTDSISRLLPGEYRGFPVHMLEDAIRWASTEEVAPESVPGYIEALLPLQTTGEAMQMASEVETEDARYVFERASERLLDVNQWTDMCGSLAASFQLTDDTGQDLQGRATVGDFIRVDIPGPGPREDRGYDWVKIEKVDEPVAGEADQLFLLQVRPSAMPSGEQGSAPLGGQGSAPLGETDTFVLERKGKRVMVTAFVRNKEVGVPGALRLSKGQWKGLIQGLLEKE